MTNLQRTAAPNGRLWTNAREIALIGTFPPQLCGIASFTADLRAALQRADGRVSAPVYAIRGKITAPYDASVVAMSVDRDDAEAYRRAGRDMNARGIEVISLQHEFGIFGGAAGDHVLRLLDAARATVITTLHTISPRLDANQRRVLKEVIDRSARVVTMAKKGRDILVDDFGADRRKIEIVPHGVPVAEAKNIDAMKAALGFEGRTVLLTFGLIGRGKGLETMIRAMPAVARSHADTLSVVLGATHPSVLAGEGEGYREMLESLARSLGVERNVAFVNRYATLNELLDYLSASDIYVTPYLKEEQITSGTLSYAYALGKPVLSTPYWHAAELLAGGRGVLCPFADSDAFASAATRLIADPVLRASIGKRALGDGMSMRWPAIGARYLGVFDDALRGEQIAEIPSVAAPRREKGIRHDAHSLIPIHAVARAS